MAIRQTTENGAFRSYGTDTGQYVNGEAGIPHGDPYPMMSYNGGVVAKPNRRAPTSDYDLTPRQFRHYVNMSVTDVQLNNGLRWRVGAGLRIPYHGSGYLYGVAPQIPGQTRDNVAGYHPRGPSPLNVQAMWDAGPGSQPANPGGPGRIASPRFYNPMTG